MSPRKKSSGKTQSGPFRVIGTRPVRPGDTLKVTGQAIFGIDVSLPDLLYGAVLRSPHAHARILSIDTSKAAALEGVRAVVTAADLPEPPEPAAGQEVWDTSARDQRDNVLAGDKVLYYGHAVAAVAAISAHIAADALELIQVSYEVLPSVVDVQQAMQEGAPILHPDLRTDELGARGDRPTNVASHQQTLVGDPQKGFERAVIIVEREFHTSAVHQGYLEPHNATALYAANGEITIWCSTQGSFSARDSTSEVLGIPASRIRVIPQEVGGGFGGKNRIYLEPLAALLSLKSGHKPVKMVMHHREVLAASGPAAASWIRVKMGVDRRGRITAASANLAFGAGAYPGSTVGVAMGTILGHYRIPNLQIDGYDVVTNTPWSASYRGLGTTNAVFASESVVDELCEKLKMDPIEFRLLNGVKEGDVRPDGRPYKRIGFLETLEAARQHPHYAAPLNGPHRGRGIASGYWGNAGGRSSASAIINPDGSVSMVTGSVDITGTRMSLAMQLAETLGIAVEDVKSTMGDTDTVAYSDGSWGSRTTFATGWAVYELGQNLISLLCQRAAEHWDVPARQVRFADGVFTVSDKTMAFKELAAELNSHIPVMASATAAPWSTGPAFATHIVDVEVDPETGQVKILRYTVAQDAGKAIQPAYVEGQIQGGTVQGIGWALNEEYFYDEAGRMQNASFLDYRIPTCSDVPSIDVVIVEVPNPGHPYGVRGVGEMSIVPPPAALANAIHAATGLRLAYLPMSPRRILEAYEEQE